MAQAEILTELSVQNNQPQYLLLARKSPYQKLASRFELYHALEKLAANENNSVILTP